MRCVAFVGRTPIEFRNRQHAIEGTDNDPKRIASTLRQGGVQLDGVQVLDGVVDELRNNRFKVRCIGFGDANGVPTIQDQFCVDGRLAVPIPFRDAEL
ncbi:hypothetical protein SULPSESMR1_03648 (plasmid) [Pseudosulfitobacter pseudonitzschiae]|uniref:Uncharacterized protein n=1 Tax=Pseudosulfitobacter pseudonitzschiae TaxID=1402135 RepID=A0A221K9K0_9RHOB|nr:hypothetical protein SULPSESMR1_03648 [Pseudosulfitobacter pseudonitzschiae]